MLLASGKPIRVAGGTMTIVASCGGLLSETRAAGRARCSLFALARENHDRREDDRGDDTDPVQPLAQDEPLEDGARQGLEPTARGLGRVVDGGTDHAAVSSHFLGA